MPARPRMAADAAALPMRLAQLLGDRGCLVEAAAMARYLEDWRGPSRGDACCVVRPTTTEEVAAVVRLCAETRTPIVPQGGLTGLVKASTPDGPEPVVILSMERMDRILAVDPVNLTLVAEAGCILHQAQTAAVAEGLRLPLRIGAEGSAHLGGNLATNAGGNLTLRYGNMRELCLGLEVVLPDGRVLDELRGLRKDNTGYDLKQLFIGAEGTLGVITRAALKLVPAPVQTATAWLALAELERVFDLLAGFRYHAGDHLSVFELVPRALMDLVLRHMPGTRDPLRTAADWYVLVEVETAQSEPDLEALVATILDDALERGLVTDGVVAQSQAQAIELRRLRELVSEAQKVDAFGLRHDVAVPIDRLVAFIRDGTALARATAPDARVLAFGHVGDGNVHFNVQARSGDHGAATLRGVAGELSDAIHGLAVASGGTFSAEHGIGRLKRAAYKQHRPVKHDLARLLKSALDPHGIMNPGVLFED